MVFSYFQKEKRKIGIDRKRVLVYTANMNWEILKVIGIVALILLIWAGALLGLLYFAIKVVMWAIGV